MKKIEFKIWNEGEYTRKETEPVLKAFLHEDGVSHPALLIVPGGAYRFISDTESEPVAKRFFRLGYQTFILDYTVNELGVPLKMQPLKDISRAMRIIRSRAEEFEVRENGVFVCGFSAGGHLCASLAVHWMDIADPVYPEVSNRPDGAVICYGVLTTGPFTHADSVRNLLGEHPTPEELTYMSLETQVHTQMPPVFVWTTAKDGLVPVENTELFGNACRKAGVRCAMHIFSHGDHGLSIADASVGMPDREIGTWVEMADLYLWEILA